MKQAIVGITILASAMFSASCATHRDVSARTSAGPNVQTLMTETLPPGTGDQVRMLTVEYPPGVDSAAHRHPGAVFVYVAEGAVKCALDDGPVQVFKKGQCWWERPGQVHRVSGNASDTEPAKLVVFFVSEAGKPVTEKAP